MHIPIIGNGDVTTPERALECFERYGVDGIMIGRASFGRPWIFKEVKDALASDLINDNVNVNDNSNPSPLTPHPSPLTPHQKLDILRQQVRESVARLDEHAGILHIRRHLAATPLFKGIPDFRPTRIRMLRAEKVDDLFAIFDEIERTFLS